MPAATAIRLRPLGDRVIVKPIEKKDEIRSGLIIPDTAKEKPQEGEIVAAGKAEACDEAQILKERVEGFFVVSYETAGGWVAITKDLLTEVLSAGRDAKIAGLPSLPIDRLRLMCRDLVSVT